MAFDLDGYKTVAERIAEFAAKYPEGCLRPVDFAEPFEIVVVGDQTFVAYYAAAYRSPDDPCPGIGCAWEPFPGKTPYTRDSELMNAETSAWGRAIVAVLASDVSKGVASREEIENRSSSSVTAGAAPKMKRARRAPGHVQPVERDGSPIWLRRHWEEAAAAAGLTGDYVLKAAQAFARKANLEPPASLDGVVPERLADKLRQWISETKERSDANPDQEADSEGGQGGGNRAG